MLLLNGQVSFTALRSFVQVSRGVGLALAVLGMAIANSLRNHDFLARYLSELALIDLGVDIIGRGALYARIITVASVPGYSLILGIAASASLRNKAIVFHEASNSRHYVLIARIIYICGRRGVLFPRA